ncbi:MAG: hypothetical protein SNJ60_01325 [Pseudanabaenaceae cyanobacterium]
MSLFRSRLFRWLAQSWPVSWGRQARQRLERPLHQLETWVRQRAAAVMVHIQPAIAPAQQVVRKLLLPAEAPPPPPLLWLEGLPLEPLPEPPARLPSRRFTARAGVRLVKVWHALRSREAGALAPPVTTLDRRVPRKSFAEILAEAIAYYFGRAKPSLPPDMGAHLETLAAPPGKTEPLMATAPQPPTLAAEVPPTVPTLETRAVFLGYAYGPLLEFLLWLDRWAERIENFCLRIWRWLGRWRRV